MSAALDALGGPQQARLWAEPRAETLVDVVAMPAARYPSLPALALSPDGTTTEALTWQGLWTGALARAGALAAGGLEPGEPVLLAVPTSAAFFTAFFGVLAGGGVPVPVATPPSLVPARLGWYADLVSGIAADAGARRFLTTARYAGPLGEVLASAGALAVTDLDAGAGAPPLAAPRAVRPSDLALLQYTSGSTSRPKGVALAHANILANASAIAGEIAPAGSSCVSWLPLYHDMGLIGAALTGLYSRTPVLFMPTSLFVKEPATWLRAIGGFGATITLAPNFAFAHAVRHAPLALLQGVSLARLRTALNGAEPIDDAAVAAFEETFASLGLRRGTVRPVYGLAESSLAVTFSDEGEHLVDLVDADLLEQFGVAEPDAGTARTRRFTSVGRPLPTQEIRIVGRDGAPLADRTVGEITVRGPSIMRGYYHRPEETAAALRDGWLHTGDLGYVSDGRLYVTGRLKELIIRHGRNYYPPDLERVVGETPGVLRGGSVVFDVASGEPRVVVVAETRLREPGELEALAREIRARCHAAFLFGPDEVRLVPPRAIPRTTSGKVRRHECRRLYLAAALPTVRRPDAPLLRAGTAG